MIEVRIKNIQKIAALRREIQDFSIVALHSIQTMKQQLNKMLQEMVHISASLEQKMYAAKDAYYAAKDALEDCEDDVYEDEDGNTIYPDCSYERAEVNRTFKEYRLAESYYRRSKEIVRKANEWLNSFERKALRYEKFAVGTSQRSIIYLDELLKLGIHYISLAGEYEGGKGKHNSLGNKVGSKIEEELNKSSNSSIRKELKNNIVTHGGNKFSLRLTESKNNRNKKFLTWNVGSATESYASLKMDKDSKSAILGDVKIKDSFLNLSKESSALSLLEKEARKKGCKEVSSYVSTKQLSFFKSNGYSIKNQSKAGAEIFKKL